MNKIGAVLSGCLLGGLGTFVVYFLLLLVARCAFGQDLVEVEIIDGNGPSFDIDNTIRLWEFAEERAGFSDKSNVHDQVWYNQLSEADQGRIKQAYGELYFLQQEYIKACARGDVVKKNAVIADIQGKPVNPDDLQDHVLTKAQAEEHARKIVLDAESELTTNAPWLCVKDFWEELK